MFALFIYLSQAALAALAVILDVGRNIAKER
jgi:hypothetical protein